LVKLYGCVKPGVSVDRSTLRAINFRLKNQPHFQVSGGWAFET